MYIKYSPRCPINTVLLSQYIFFVNIKTVKFKQISPSSTLPFKSVHKTLSLQHISRLIITHYKSHVTITAPLTHLIELQLPIFQYLPRGFHLATIVTLYQLKFSDFIHFTIQSNEPLVLLRTSSVTAILISNIIKRIRQPSNGFVSAANT